MACYREIKRNGELMFGWNVLCLRLAGRLFQKEKCYDLFLFMINLVMFMLFISGYLVYNDKSTSAT